MSGDEQNLDWARASLVLQARQAGIMDGHILKALESVPREVFVPVEYIEHAYRDVSIPLDHHQSMISPIKLAKMLAALDLSEMPTKVLEVGTGSGYATALISRMCKRVFTVERDRLLLRGATAHWKSLGIPNIVEANEDGLEGWAHQAPFSRIILNGSIQQLPQTIVDQLEEDGILIAAIGAANEVQQITRVIKTEGHLDITEVGTIRLQALKSGKSTAP